MPGGLISHREDDIIFFAENDYIGAPGIVRSRSGAGNTGAVFLFDRLKHIGYNMLNKGAGR